MKMMMRVEGVMWVKKCPGAKRVIFAFFTKAEFLDIAASRYEKAMERTMMMMMMMMKKIIMIENLNTWCMMIPWVRTITNSGNPQSIVDENTKYVNSLNWKISFILIWY